MSEPAYAIKITGLRKSFKIPHERYNSLKQSAINVLKPKRYVKFKALEELSLEIKPGEFFSIIGQNGSGKSTLLKILAGIYTASSGSIDINGRLSPFIELGVGFNPELTARENIFLNGAILGLSRQEIKQQFHNIISFAELEEFVDQKIKNFSSGMMVRLAFSVAIRAHADILLIDEVLAVGDANFQQKCYDIFRQLKAEGRTIVFVSHDLASVKEFSDRVLVLNKAKDCGIYPPSEAITVYSKLNQERVNKEMAAAKPGKHERFGENLPTIEAVTLLKDKNPSHVFNRGDDLTVRLAVKDPAETQFQLGVAIYRSDGFYCFGTNTDLDEIELGRQPNQTAELTFKEIRLQRGTYYLTIGLFGSDVKTIYEMRERAIEFFIDQDDGYEGLAFLPHAWKRDHV